MKTFRSALLLAILSVFAAAGLMAADSDKLPYTVGSSYFLVLSATAPAAGVELPSGPVTVTENSDDWIRIKYSTFKNERSKENPGEVVSVETVHQAWINLDHVAALIEPAKSK